MRQKLLAKLGQLAAERTGWMLLGIVVITLILGMLAGRLEMSMNLTDILPANDPMVTEFNYILKEFNGASTIFIVVEGEMENMIRYAEYITPLIENFDNWMDSSASSKIQAEHRTAMEKVRAGKIEFQGRYIERVNYKLETDFLRKHGLMLIEPKDLKNMQEIYTDPNIVPFLTNLNNSLEKEYIRSEEKISTTQREQQAVQYLDGLETWVDEVGKALYEPKFDRAYADAAARAVTIGNPYMISPDRSMLIILVEPTFSCMEMDFVLPVVNGLEELVKSAAPAFNVTSGLAGATGLARDEYIAAMEDSMLLTILALIAVLILFVVTFKMLSAPLLAVLNLIIGLVWAMGISYLLVGTLNMFTAMMAVVLVGLGIDFSIHIISVFSELIHQGVDAKKAIIDTLKKVGTGIITGGLTTAAAFLTLIIGRSRGISEFGLVCGTGLIIIMLTTLLTLPTMLMVREYYRRWRGKTIASPRDVSYSTIGNFSESIFKRWKISIVIIVIVTLFFAIMCTRVTMDYNYLNMEPEGLESIILNDKLIDKFNFSSDVTMMTAKSLAENYHMTQAAKEKSSISYVESISDYLPTEEEQHERRSAVRNIRSTMTASKIQTAFLSSDLRTFIRELQRLEDNIIEMQDLSFIGGHDQLDTKATLLVGHPEKPESVGNLTCLLKQIGHAPPSTRRFMWVSVEFANCFKQLVLDMANPEPITRDMLPAVIRDKFISTGGDRYLITVYPKGNVWSIDYLEVFTKEVLDITPSISGTPPMFYYMLKIIGQDGRRAAFLTLTVVFLFLVVDFRSVKYALFTMLPLCVALVWTVGFMGLTGIQFTLLNIMAIPLILGIGIDDGVHVLHRYKIEGKGSVNPVFRSTGKAIIITSLTTMLAFGSLVFATYRGFGSLGLALFIGVAMCLITTTTVLPAILAVTERKNQTNRGH
ncbi:MAG TPA: hypothetical protein ENN20_04285 [Candidatus Marinimicrobia bacterium]|nr:hypothetical protein [Candidatus Neomarinimicrobiota bacterium]